MDLLAVFLCSRWQACCKYCSDIQSDIMQWSCFVYLCPLVFFIIYHESKIVSFFKVIMLGLACKACTGVFYFLKKGGDTNKAFCVRPRPGEIFDLHLQGIMRSEIHRLRIALGSFKRINCTDRLHSLKEQQKEQWKPSPNTCITEMMACQSHILLSAPSLSAIITSPSKGTISWSRIWTG